MPWSSMSFTAKVLSRPPLRRPTALIRCISTNLMLETEERIVDNTFCRNPFCPRLGSSSGDGLVQSPPGPPQRRIGDLARLLIQGLSSYRRYVDSLSAKSLNRKTLLWVWIRPRGRRSSATYRCGSASRPVIPRGR
jgi:hypothetical protein